MKMYPCYAYVNVARNGCYVPDMYCCYGIAMNMYRIIAWHFYNYDPYKDVK